MKVKFICLILASVIAVSGCTTGELYGAAQRLKNGSQVQENILQQSLFSRGDEAGSMLAVSGIELPVSQTRIFVNRTGYDAVDVKKIVFSGDGYGDTYDIVRQEDREIVYTGKIPQAAYDVNTGNYVSIADFSEFTDTGKYYIETAVVGQSYPFTITDDAYSSLFLNIVKNISSEVVIEDADGVCDASFGMNVIMYAMQCNGELFETTYGLMEETDRKIVEQLLYVADMLISKQQNDGSLYGDYEATAAFCGIISMCRTNFGKYAEDVDRTYEKAVDKAWSWIEANKANSSEKKAAKFYAAAQMFNSGNDEIYREISEQYINEKESNYSEDSFTFYGTLAYMGAKSEVDRDLCTYIMMDMVERTETICDDVAKDKLFNVGTDLIGDNMSNMLHLCFINYLVPSREYTDMIENIIQYIGGFNGTGTCYIGEDGIWKIIPDNENKSFEWTGIMLFAISDLMTEE